jgi:hypothetical protein
VLNRAARPIHGVVITDSLNGLATLVRAPGCLVNGTSVGCPVGDIAGGQEATSTIVVVYSTAGLNVSDQLNASSADAGPADGVIQATVTHQPVEFPANVPGPVPLGQEATTTVSARNYTGDISIGPVTMTDNIGSRWSPVRIPPACSVNAQTITCQTALLAPQGSADYVLVLRAIGPEFNYAFQTISGSAPTNSVPPFSYSTYVT